MSADNPRQLGPRAAACIMWACHPPFAEPPELELGVARITGVLAGIAIALRDANWARAAAQELTDAGYPMPDPGITPSEQRAAYWALAQQLQGEAPLSEPQATDLAAASQI